MGNYERRFQPLVKVLTSNLDFGEWGETFAANKMIGVATLDRLCHGAYRVVLDGDVTAGCKLIQIAD
jgi:DNA replication protein DnaC